jgi:hypothetical protein
MQEHRDDDAERAKRRAPFMDEQTEEIPMETPTPPTDGNHPDAPTPKAPRTKPKAKPNPASLFRGTAPSTVHQELRLYHRNGASMHDYFAAFQELLHNPMFFMSEHNGYVLPNPTRYVEFAIRYAIMMRWIRDQYRVHHVRFFVLNTLRQPVGFEEALTTTYIQLGRRNLYDWDDLRTRMVIPREGPWPTPESDVVGQMDVYMTHMRLQVDLRYLEQVLSSPDGTWGFIDNNVHISEIPIHELWIATQRNPMHDYFLNMLRDWRENAALMTSDELMSRDFRLSIPHASPYWQLPAPMVTSHGEGLFITNPPSEVMARYAAFLWNAIQRGPVADRYVGPPPVSITMDSRGRVTSDPLASLGYLDPETRVAPATFHAWTGRELGMPQAWEAPPAAPAAAADATADNERRGPTDGGPGTEPGPGSGPGADQTTGDTHPPPDAIEFTHYGIHGWTRMVPGIRNACFWRSIMVFQHGTRRTGIREADLTTFVNEYWDWVINMPDFDRVALEDRQPFTLDQMPEEFARRRDLFYRRNPHDDNRMDWFANDFHIETMSLYLKRRIVVQNVDQPEDTPHFTIVGHPGHPAGIYIQHQWFSHFEALLPNGPRTTVEITHFLENEVSRRSNPIRITERVPALRGVEGELDLHPHHIEAFRAQGIVYVEPDGSDGDGPNASGSEGGSNDNGHEEEEEDGENGDTLMRVADVQFVVPEITEVMLQNNLGPADPTQMTDELLRHIIAYYSNPELENAWMAGRPAASAIVGPSGQEYRLRDLYQRFPLLINEFRRNWDQYRKRLDVAQRRDPEFQAQARKVGMDILRLLNDEQQRVDNQPLTRASRNTRGTIVALQNPDDVDIEYRHNRHTRRYQLPVPAVTDDRSTDRPGSSLPSTPRDGGGGGGGGSSGGGSDGGDSESLPSPPPAPRTESRGTSPTESGTLFRPPGAWDRMEEDAPPASPPPAPSTEPDPVLQHYNELLQQYNQQTQELIEARETLIKAQQDHGQELANLSHAEQVKHDLLKTNSLQNAQRTYEAHQRDLARLHEQLTQQEAALQEARTAIQDSGRVFETQRAQIEQFQREREELQAQWEHRNAQFNHRAQDLEAERQRITEVGVALENQLRQTRGMLHGILRDNETYLLQNEAQRRAYLAGEQDEGFQAIQNRALADRHMREAIRAHARNRPGMGELEARQELERIRIERERDGFFTTIANYKKYVDDKEVDDRNARIDASTEETIERQLIQLEEQDDILANIQIQPVRPRAPVPPPVPPPVSVHSDDDTSLPPPSEHPIKEEDDPNDAGVGQRVDDDTASSHRSTPGGSEHDRDETQMSDTGSTHTVPAPPPTTHRLPSLPPSPRVLDPSSTPPHTPTHSESESTMFGGLFSTPRREPADDVHLYVTPHPFYDNIQPQPQPQPSPFHTPVDTPRSSVHSSFSAMTYDYDYDMAPPTPRAPGPVRAVTKGARGFDVAPDILDPRRARHKLFGDFRNALIGTVRPDPRMPRQAGAVVPRRFH